MPQYLCHIFSVRTSTEQPNHMGTWHEKRSKKYEIQLNLVGPEARGVLVVAVESREHRVSNSEARNSAMSIRGKSTTLKLIIHRH